MKKILLVVVSFLIISNDSEARNLILFVGDGMGTNIITATRFYKDSNGNKDLFIDTVPLIAHVKTKSANKMTTDSAASVTAMATGEKTKNNCLGLKKSCLQKDSIINIVEIAKHKGMSVGVVTTTRITHATPAGFYAHTNDRNNEKEIAQQLLNSNINIALGGGKKYFSNDVIVNSKFKIIDNLHDLNNLNECKNVVGVFADSHIPYVLERNGKGYKGPNLDQMTKIAIKCLSKNPNGYFLMVEGGRIDHAAHENLTKYVFEETLEFDNAIKNAFKITKNSDTAILITADHSTGGLSLNGYPDLGADIFGKVGFDKDHKPYPILTWATGTTSQYKSLDPDDPNTLESAHTGDDVPLYGYGLINTSGLATIENTDIFKIINKELFN